MARPKVRLSASTHSERNGVLGAVNDAIRAAGGWVDDVNFFSNISVSLRFALRPDRGPDFAQLLNNAGVRIDREGREQFLRLLDECLETEVMCSINITFVHDGRDLRQHIPSVPG